ncbi:hypothetical protein VQ284_000351 [Salmonella enterica]|uniref:hypothetical protein n=1 Tax=Salmonella enterica TaxID=28901 RepID=UPI001CF2F9E4|nr:hypothetical protein [Salmonella enterica]MCB2237083.1 hypothetical protein [Salmonella enterica subsp. diarizonae]ELF0565337.1 hypothetical protein [Salmonella enterica]ELH5828073.1 hypothetical protein [Salmonella enterica]ELI6224233.1 hypothetical protein [Salmonella enterica]
MEIHGDVPEPISSVQALPQGGKNGVGELCIANRTFFVNAYNLMGWKVISVNHQQATISDNVGQRRETNVRD